MRSASGGELTNESERPTRGAVWGEFDRSRVSRRYFDGLTLVILILLFSVSFWNFTVTFWLA